MKPARLLFWAMFFGAAMSSQGALAANDRDAAVVKLRTSCLENNQTLNNCFTTTSALQNWINARLNSSASLSVEIGPGTFGGFTCDKSNITLKGSGPDVTILDGGNSRVGIVGGSSCINFNVQDLTVSGSLFSVYWHDNGGSSSRWTNVSVVADGYAWNEGCSGTANSNRSVHYWFNSRLSTSTAGKVYNVFCSENWFFGSEIMALGSEITGQSVAFLVASQNSTAKPEVHVYGSVIRAIAKPGVSYPIPRGFNFNANGIIAVAAGRNADVHIHGTGIDVIGNELPNGVAALVAWDGGKIHANEAAYNLKTGTGGTVTRIMKDTNPATDVHAPYLWGQYPTPQHPSLPNITSLTGTDMAVVTDTSDRRPHLVIYDSTCTSKWYDTTDKRCRP